MLPLSLKSELKYVFAIVISTDKIQRRPAITEPTTSDNSKTKQENLSILSKWKTNFSIHSLA